MPAVSPINVKSACTRSPSDVGDRISDFGLGVSECEEGELETWFEGSNLSLSSLSFSFSSVVLGGFAVEPGKGSGRKK